MTRLFLGIIFNTRTLLFLPPFFSIQGAYTDISPVFTYKSRCEIKAAHDAEIDRLHTCIFQVELFRPSNRTIFDKIIGEWYGITVIKCVLN